MRWSIDRNPVARTIITYVCAAFWPCVSNIGLPSHPIIAHQKNILILSKTCFIKICRKLEMSHVYEKLGHWLYAEFLESVKPVPPRTCGKLLSHKRSHHIYFAEKISLSSAHAVVKHTALNYDTQCHSTSLTLAPFHHSYPSLAHFDCFHVQIELKEDSDKDFLQATAADRARLFAERYEAAVLGLQWPVSNSFSRPES